MEEHPPIACKLGEGSWIEDNQLLYFILFFYETVMEQDSLEDIGIFYKNVCAWWLGMKKQITPGKSSGSTITLTRI